MKSLVFVLAMTVMTSVAQAEIYSCEDSGNPRIDERGRYVLALRGDSGILYRSDYGYLRALDHEVKVVRAMDGGPVMVGATPKLEKIDWDKEESCFKMAGASYTFRVSVKSDGDAGSVLQISPVFYTDPRAMCDMPNVMIPPPQLVTCELL